MEKENDKNTLTNLPTSQSASTILRSYLQAKKLVNARYSLRAMAKRAGLSPSHLSLLINGERSLTVDVANQLIERLLLSPEESQDLLFEARHLKQSRKYNPGKLKSAELARKSAEISLNRFESISNWLCYGILGLLKITGLTADKLARRLSVNESTLKTPLKALTRLGLITKDTDHVFKRSKVSIQTSSSHNRTPSVAVKRFHAQCLELANQHLIGTPVDKRTFNFKSVLLTPERYTQLSKEIDDFLLFIADKYGEKKGLAPDEIEKLELYGVSLQAYPLRQIENRQIENRQIHSDMH